MPKYMISPYFFQFALIDRIKKENEGANVKNTLVNEALTPAHPTTLSLTFTSLFSLSPLCLLSWLVPR